MVTKLKDIRRSYVRGFFFIDFLSIIPVNYIMQAMDDGTG